MARWAMRLCVSVPSGRPSESLAERAASIHTNSVSSHAPVDSPLWGFFLHGTHLQALTVHFSSLPELAHGHVLVPTSGRLRNDSHRANSCNFIGRETKQFAQDKIVVLTEEGCWNGHRRRSPG